MSSNCTRQSKDVTIRTTQVYLHLAYIPPENSKYSSEEAFIEVEDELLFFSRDHTNFALAGDFNSRTSNASDIVELDANLLIF